MTTAYKQSIYAFLNFNIIEHSKHQSRGMPANQRFMVLIVFLWPAEVRVQEWGIATFAPDKIGPN